MKITCQGTAYIQQLHISKPVQNMTPEYSDTCIQQYNT